VSIAAPENALASRERRLYEALASFDSVIVAFSGGVDSAYLAWAATSLLGPAALCVTADSPSYPDHHRQLALRIAREFGLHHEFVRTAEVERPEYRANPVNRCYYCKSELYDVLSRLAAERGIAMIVDGSNADDRSDYRPGRQAAREFGIRSPLDEADLTKTDIRELSRRAGLPTWDEPASACLSSRIPYNSEVTPDKLRMIERAEAVLRDLGFRVCRVRHHETLARLEIGADELNRALEAPLREQIVRELQAIGYHHVTIDLRGYRMGSLNEGVRLRPA
jgi:pyridinium-3,5-biscarboxylic acid mononucleotide sulfurtransferase